eukprot:scaffold417217_cov50-Prasinocladus_malaysianus.AAC.1
MGEDDRGLLFAAAASALATTFGSYWVLTYRKARMQALDMDPIYNITWFLEPSNPMLAQLYFRYLGAQTRTWRNW